MEQWDKNIFFPVLLLKGASKDIFSWNLPPFQPLCVFKTGHMHDLKIAPLQCTTEPYSTQCAAQVFTTLCGNKFEHIFN